MSTSPPKTLLLFSPDGAAGGGTTVALGLAEGMRGQGWRVVMLTETGSYCAKHGEVLGAEVRTAPFMGARTDPSLAAAVSRVVEETSPDVVHLHGTRAAFFGRGLHHPKVLCTIHGYHFLRRPLPFRFLGWLGARQSFGSIRDLIFVSDYDRRTGQRLRLIPPAARSHVIHNGVSLPPMPEAPRKHKQIAFPHRLALPKDPLMALSTLDLLKGEGYSMVCAGSGELEATAKEEAHRRNLPVTFAGGMSRESTLRLIQESDVMLMTSLWEGFPMTPLEAMALGTPVVASSVCGIPEMIESGVHGLLAHEHSAKAYASAIQQLEDPNLRDNLTAAAMARVREQFTWEHTFQQHLSLYTD